MKQKNEAGYTLVLVLLTITLIFIFSATLISNVLNSATQNKKAEEQIQLKQSSQMGVTYVERAIVKASNQASLNTIPTPTSTNTDIATEYKKNFKVALKSLIDYEKYPEIEIISEEANKYQFKISNITIIDSATTITVKYIITPSFNGKYSEKDPVREKKINLTITQPASS